MNISKFIKSFLGFFWTDFISDKSFSKGFIDLHSFILKKNTEKEKQDTGRLFASETAVHDASFPFVMYFLKETVVDADTGYAHHVREAYGIDKVLLQGCGLYEDDVNAGFAVKSFSSTPEPWFITDHVIDYTKTLFNRADFILNNGQFIFYTDPSKLGFDEVSMLDSSGHVRVYYKAFGWSKPSYEGADAVDAFYSPRLRPYSNIVWEIHQKGATVANVKELLSHLTDSVIAETAGVVRAIWVEQGYTCVRVDDKVYVSRVKGTRCDVRTGQHVKAGTVLLGNLCLLHGNEVKAEPRYISESSSTVTRITDTEDATIVETEDGHIYNAPVTWECNCIEGQSVSSGDELFTPSESVLDNSTVISREELSSMLIRTDAGDLAADNEYKKALSANIRSSAGVQTAINIMPLAGKNIDEYVEQCKRDVADRNIPEVVVPSYLNPMMFILNKLRKAYEVLVCISGLRSSALSQCIDCIQKNMIASCILDVYVNVYNEECTLDIWSHIDKLDASMTAGVYTGSDGTNSLSINSILA